MHFVAKYALMIGLIFNFQQMLGRWSEIVKKIQMLNLQIER